MRLFLCLIFVGVVSISWGGELQSANVEAESGPRSKWDRRGYESGASPRRVRKPKLTEEQKQERRYQRKKRRFERSYKIYQKESQTWGNFTVLKGVKYAMIYGLFGVLIKWSIAVFPFYIVYYLLILLLVYLYWRVRRSIWQRRVEEYELGED